MKLIKKFVMWDFDRETSQYLIFCLLIVAFIFLTPKTWFEKGDRGATQTQRGAVQPSEPSRDVLR